MSPALVGRFFTTEPLGSPQSRPILTWSDPIYFEVIKILSYIYFITQLLRAYCVINSLTLIPRVVYVCLAESHIVTTHRLLGGGGGHWPSETSSSNSATPEIHSVPKQVVSQSALNLKHSFRTCDLDVFWSIDI